MARDTVIGAVVITAVALGSLSFASAPPSTTQLIIEISGGFAFIQDPSDRRIHVAYLKNVYVAPDTDTNGDGSVTSADEPVCDVQPIGTELMVVRGNITESLPLNKTPANRSYDLAGSKVTISDLTGSMPTAIRTLPTPSNVTAPASWTDLQFVPSIKDFHSGSRIIGGWKNRVDGYITLRGGKLEASVPTDPLVQNTYFEFKQNGTVVGRSAVTDKVIYTVDVPGDHVELRFSQSTIGFSRLKITPPASGGPVRLRLRGLHSMSSAASYADGDEIKDFCAFYSLFKKNANPFGPEPSPMSSSERLKMFYVNNTPRPAGGDQPSPGFFCDGSWF